MDVAVLGTGKMGAAIAGRLHEQGHALHLWNRTPARAEALGFGSVYDTPAQAAADADVAVSVLTGPEAVRQVYLGAQGALEAGGGRVYVDITTASPDVHVEVAEAAAGRGAAFIEAPVLGFPPAAAAGRLLVLVGGDDTAIEGARPVLGALGEVRPIGPLGSAIRVKLVANSYLAITHAAAAELLAAGTRSGLDIEAVFAVLARFVRSSRAAGPSSSSGATSRCCSGWPIWPRTWASPQMSTGTGGATRRLPKSPTISTPGPCPTTPSSTSRLWPRSSTTPDLTGQ